MSYEHFEGTCLPARKYRVRESRSNAMNESERNSTAAGVAAILRSIAMKQSIRLATECLLSIDFTEAVEPSTLLR